MNEAEKLFEGKAITRHEGVTLYSKQDAIEFIKVCKNLDIKILGIDGFILGDTSIQPLMENSIDFSTYQFKSSENVYDIVLEFFGKQSDKLFFEIVSSE